MPKGVLAKPIVLIAGAVAGAVAGVVAPSILASTQSAQAANAQPLAARAQIEERLKSQVQPFLQANCYRCHGNGKHKGDVALDKFTSLASIQSDRKTWNAVRDQLQQHDMPPKKAPQPPAGQVSMVLKFAADALNFVDASAPRDPGFVPIHRLNRNEYNNTIRDLVGVDFKPADDFPADDSGYGFDNIADVLSMSPLLAEKYLAAAEQVMDKAIVTENPNRSRVTKYIGSNLSGGEAMPDEGHRILYSAGEITQQHHFVANGKYEFRIGAEADPAGAEPAKMKVTLGKKEIQTFEVADGRGHPKVYVFQTEVTAGDHKLKVAFTNDFYDPKASDPGKRDRNLIIDSIEIEGPINLPPPEPSEVQKKLLFCGPADGESGEACASNIIRRFAGRAFRRPATGLEVGKLLALYRQARAQGDSFSEACRFALTAVLVSPQFVYRIELDPIAKPQTPHAIDDYELATRLSYFLWSSMPDDELFQLASEHKLHQPAVLDSQVKRMLADPRSQAFITNFAGQWLELRNLDVANPDPKQFPQFARLREDMRREGELFFQGIVCDDQSVLDLLDANYTFVNQRLARLYGIDGVSGNEFRRVEFTGEQAGQRGGVMTMAAVLTVTALPNRTSPVRRGKFILDQILGMPPPPQPPNVPPLEDKATDVAGISVRKRFEAHRANPACASCHVRMDPLGFSLENFDAIGRWRDHDGSFPVDSSGKMPDGQTFSGPAGLRTVLLAHKEQFLECFIEKLMTYALGRGTEGYDYPTIKEIATSAEQNGYRFSTLVNGIVHSDAFLKRRGKTPKVQVTKSE